jgi:hypothetical protein
MQLKAAFGLLIFQLGFEHSKGAILGLPAFCDPAIRYNPLGNPVEMWPVLKTLTKIVSD